MVSFWHQRQRKTWAQLTSKIVTSFLDSMKHFVLLSIMSYIAFLTIQQLKPISHHSGVRLKLSALYIQPFEMVSVYLQLHSRFDCRTEGFFTSFSQQPSLALRVHNNTKGLHNSFLYILYLPRPYCILLGFLNGDEPPSIWLYIEKIDKQTCTRSTVEKSIDGSAAKQLIGASHL